MAPEAIEKLEFTQAADVYSFGKTKLLKAGSQYTQPLTRHGRNAVTGMDLQAIVYSCVKLRDNPHVRVL